MYALVQSDVNLPAVNLDQSAVGKVLRIVWTISGIISVIFVAIGGLKYTISGGDPNGISSAKDTILYALIGLVVSVSAFAITGFVLGRL